MSAQQADLLTSELWALRRAVAPALERICRMYLALEGLSSLMGTVRMMKKSVNPNLDIEGVLLTMYDGRTNLSLQVANEVKRYLKDKVYKTVIPRNVRLSEAPSHFKPVIAYDRASKGSVAYMELAEEVLKRNKDK